MIRLGMLSPNPSWSDGSVVVASGGALDVAPASSAVGIPAGTVAQRPASPNNGGLRFDTDSSSLETFRGNWASLVRDSMAVYGRSTNSPIYSSDTYTTFDVALHTTSDVSATLPTSTITVNRGGLWYIEYYHQAFLDDAFASFMTSEFRIEVNGSVVYRAITSNWQHTNGSAPIIASASAVAGGPYEIATGSAVRVLLHPVSGTSALRMSQFETLALVLLDET